jgi:hypothetical protein
LHRAFAEISTRDGTQVKLARVSHLTWRAPSSSLRRCRVEWVGFVHDDRAALPSRAGTDAGDPRVRRRGSKGNDTIDVVDGISGNDTADGGEGADACTRDPGDTAISCP